MKCPNLLRVASRVDGRDGFALILVLIVVAMLALSTYTFSSLMVAENSSAVLHGQQLQTRAAVDSGVAHVRYFLELEETEREGLGGVYNNPQLFQAQVIVDHPSAQARVRFGVVASQIDTQGLPGGIRFGLQDESARLNLNALNLEIEAGAQIDEQNQNSETGNEEDDEIDTSGRAMLMNLPGMTIDMADAILDWIDEDDEPREYGAELDFYSGMTPPYTPQNGPLQSIEELLLVRGVTPDLLFGRDVNRNGMIDVAEMDLPMAAELGYDDGSMDYGWASYLTLFSQEKNVNLDGEPRINLNADDMEQLFNDLSGVFETSWATFIVAYRQFGPYTGNDQNSVPTDAQQLDLSQPAKVPLAQVLDLIGAKVRVTIQGDTMILESPFSDTPAAMSGYLPQLMDRCTVVDSPTIPGRININRAPRFVLLSIPGMETEIADSIISQRDLANSEYDDTYAHETWILSRAIVTLDEMKTMMPFVCAGGEVFRAQIVGYHDAGEISARAEVIFDATRAYPRILSWRDLSHFGRGFAREMLGVDIN